MRYSECDAQNIVFNARYADYVDLAATEYTRAVWGDYQNLLEAGLDNKVVSLHLDWSASASFDDVLCATVKTSHIGTTSYVLDISFNRHPCETLLATATIVYVMIDSSTGSKIAINDELREKLSLGASNCIVNHAGVSL